MDRLRPEAVAPAESPRNGSLLLDSALYRPGGRSKATGHPESKVEAT